MTFPQIAALLDGVIRSRATPDYGGKPLGNTVSWRIDPRGRNHSAVVQQNAGDRMTLDLYVKNDPFGERREFGLDDGTLDAIGHVVADHLNARGEAPAET